MQDNPHFLRCKFRKLLIVGNKLLLKSEAVSVFWFLNTTFINQGDRHERYADGSESSRTD
jgi:hypothetical protein